MEVIAKYGSAQQKREWLQPLLDGKIRSAFLMTERAVASSDAKNISMSCVREGDELVLNGSVCFVQFTPRSTSNLLAEMVEQWSWRSTMQGLHYSDQD